MAVAQCPASCGELIQGWILDSEKLISCPIDWYSTVEVRSGAPLADERPLSRAMINQVLALFHYPVKMSQSLRLEIHSTIPIAKGMASSTADIAATAVATAHHLGHTLDEATLAKLCVALEPTDSTIFRQLTLFDHKDASTQEACAAQPKIDVLVLESPETLRTEDYHRTPRRAGLLAGAPMLKQAWEKVRLACASQDSVLLGEAATLSAIASQPLLPKPHFSTLLDVAEACDLYGINVAHSGSVVGLLLDRRMHDVEQVRWLLGKKHLTAHWPEQHLLTMVEGGVTLL